MGKGRVAQKMEEGPVCLDCRVHERKMRHKTGKVSWDKTVALANVCVHLTQSLETHTHLSEKT